MNGEPLAQSIADYLATRATPWPDEQSMREAVYLTVGLLLTEARPDLMNVLEQEELEEAAIEFAGAAPGELDAADEIEPSDWAIALREDLEYGDEGCSYTPEDIEEGKLKARDYEAWANL